MALNPCPSSHGKGDDHKIKNDRSKATLGKL